MQLLPLDFVLLTKDDCAMDDDEEHEVIYWGALCQECASRLLAERLSENPCLFISICEIHGITAVLDRQAPER
jgi:hypothetical protein